MNAIRKICSGSDDPELRDRQSRLFMENTNYPKIIFGKYKTNRLEITNNIYYYDAYYDVELHGTMYGLYTVVEKCSRISGAEVCRVAIKLLIESNDRIKNKQIKVYLH